MKYSFYVTALHFLMAVFNVLSVIFLDYQYMIYVILLNSFVLLGWLLNKECFMKEYEMFVQCTYENDTTLCNECNKNPRLHFHIDPFEKSWLFVIVLQTIAITRYVYKYNLITFDTTFMKTIFLDLGFATICILLLMLLLPALHYHHTYKNKKQLYMYVVYTLVFFSIFIYYFTQHRRI